MCLASVILVVGPKSVIAFTFGFREEIPFLDTKCPKYSISLLKKITFGHFQFVPCFMEFFKYSFAFILNVLLQFGCILTNHPSKILENMQISDK